METLEAAKEAPDAWISSVLRARLGVPAAELDRAVRGRPSAARAAVAAGLASREAIDSALREAYGFGWREPAAAEAHRLALSQLGEARCRRLLCLPTGLDEAFVELVCAAPLDAPALDEIRAVTGRDPRPSFCPPDALERTLAALFEGDTAVFDALERIEAHEPVELIRRGAIIGAEAEAARAPVVRLVDSLIARAAEAGASDLHIDHEEARSVARLRVDGVLRNELILPRHLAAGPLVTRLKIMADLDIADRMRPQDGRFAVRVGGREYDLRLSTLPTQFGEKTVIRLLDQRTPRRTLAELGFDAPAAAALGRAVQAQEGIFLMTGPTGSGKTTTLHAMLRLLRSEELNIVTIEDPIEYRLEGANQVQVQEAQGLTFASALRSALRQDPDVIMIGEIRDVETARIAAQAAQTGHFVLSTLHANDAVSAIVRLLDMGVEPFVAASALRVASSQRLLRRLCVDCKRPEGDGGRHAPVGCARCGFSGYRGRVTVLELLRLDPELRALVARWPGEAEFRRAALERGALRTLADAASACVAAGETSLEEAAPCLGRTEAAKLRSGGAQRVLVVDDDPAVLMLLGETLRLQGLEVREAADGEAALDALRESDFAAVITDLHMPRVDGKALVGLLRADPRRASTPVLVVTSDASDRVQGEVLDAGADDFLAKPFKPEVVAARVRAALRRSRGRVS